MTVLTAANVIEMLELKPHPEGGIIARHSAIQRCMTGVRSRR
jgi:predicted cupin superfamily sugar epimerase